jgi:vacuolar protein sorting-associated protein 13A/C
VIGNIQVTVKELHIRYEDSVSHPAAPFVFGITLEEVGSFSCVLNVNSAGHVSSRE